jgi:hypothetical protein
MKFKNILLPLIALMFISVEAESLDDQDGAECKSSDFGNEERSFSKDFTGTFNGKKT